MIIKLTTHEKIYVNTRHIVVIESNTTKSGSVVRLITGEKLQVQETPDSLWALINSSNR